MYHGDVKSEKKVSASVLSITSEMSLAANQRVSIASAFKYPPLCGSWDDLAAGH